MIDSGIDELLETLDNLRGEVENQKALLLREDIFAAIESEERSFRYLMRQLADIAGRFELACPVGNLNIAPRVRAKASRVLVGLSRDLLIDAVPTIDFTLELRRREPLVSSTVNSVVFSFLVAVAGWDDGLVRENHDNKGLHFHHVDTKRGENRTSVLLTFDPAELVGPPDTLFWEHHGAYGHTDPTRWGTKRRVAIHAAARPSIHRPGKVHFLRPSRRASILCKE